MSQNRFSKIASRVALTAILGMSVSGALHAQEAQPTQVDPNAPHISGTDLLKNTGIGAVGGAILGKVFGGSGSTGALWGAAAGVGKSIYDDMQIKKAAEQQKTAQSEAAKNAPVVDAKATPNMARPITQTINMPLLTKADGSAPTGFAKTTGKVTVVEGNSMLDALVTVSAIAHGRHRIKVDILSDQAAILKQQSMFNEKVTYKFNGDDANETLKALHTIANEMNMGMLYEDYKRTGAAQTGERQYNQQSYSGYVVLGAKPTVRNLLGQESLARATNDGGISSSDVDAALVNLEAQQALERQQGAQNARAYPLNVNPNYRQSSGGLMPPPAPNRIVYR